MEKTSGIIETTAHSVEKTTETLANLLLLFMGKLAGKESDLRLSFEDLTFEVGLMKAKLNGAIVFNVVYAKDAMEDASKSEQVSNLRKVRAE